MCWMVWSDSRSGGKRSRTGAIIHVLVMASAVVSLPIVIIAFLVWKLIKYLARPSTAQS